MTSVTSVLLFLCKILKICNVSVHTELLSPSLPPSLSLSLSLNPADTGFQKMRNSNAEPAKDLRL